MQLAAHRLRIEPGFPDEAHGFHADSLTGLDPQMQIDLVPAIWNDLWFNFSIGESALKKLLAEIHGHLLGPRPINRGALRQVHLETEAVRLNPKIVEDQLRFFDDMEDDRSAIILRGRFGANIGKLTAGPKRANVLADGIWIVRIAGVRG